MQFLRIAYLRRIRVTVYFAERRKQNKVRKFLLHIQQHFLVCRIPGFAFQLVWILLQIIQHGTRKASAYKQFIPFCSQHITNTRFFFGSILPFRKHKVSLFAFLQGIPLHGRRYRQSQRLQNRWGYINIFRKRRVHTSCPLLLRIFYDKRNFSKRLIQMVAF